MKLQRSALLLTVIPFVSLFGESETEENEEGFKASTVSSFMNSKYTWAETSKKKTDPKEEENHTPLKTRSQKEAESIATRANGNSSQFTDSDHALDEVQLREFTVNEFYSPLMRMGEMKDIDTLVPESAPGFLKEKYFTNFENNILNRWTLPLIGKSQEQLARDRYLKEKEKALYRKAGRIVSLMYQWDAEKAKELRRDVYEVHFQTGWSYPESRIKTP